MTQGSAPCATGLAKVQAGGGGGSVPPPPPEQAASGAASSAAATIHRGMRIILPFVQNGRPGTRCPRPASCVPAVSAPAGVLVHVGVQVGLRGRNGQQRPVRLEDVEVRV